MSKKTLDFEKNIMEKVVANEIRMKPRWYFVAGSLLIVTGVVSASIAAVFLINLSFFLFRSHGPMVDVRFHVLLTTFPWWVPVLALASIVLGILLLRKYDFSYKKNMWLLMAGFIVSLIVAAFIIDASGLNTIWARRGPMRGLYQHFEGQPGMRRHSNQFRGNPERLY